MSSVKRWLLRKLWKNSLSSSAIQSKLMVRQSVHWEQFGQEKSVKWLWTNMNVSMRALQTQRFLIDTCYTTLLMCLCLSKQFFTCHRLMLSRLVSNKNHKISIFIPEKFWLKKNAKNYFQAISDSSKVLLTVKICLSIFQEKIIKILDLSLNWEMCSHVVASRW